MLNMIRSYVQTKLFTDKGLQPDEAYYSNIKMQLINMDHNVALEIMWKDMENLKQKTEAPWVQNSNHNKALYTTTTEIKEDIEAKLQINN